MSFTKLFESLDEKVFTTELKADLESQFNEAVETKAQEIADTRIDEEITALNAKAEEHIEFLNEQAEKFVEEKQTEMVESLDKYLDRVVEEFITGAKEKLDESEKSEKADMIIECIDTMLIAAGVEVSRIVEAKDEADITNKLDESVEKYDALVEENITLKQENDNLIKMGIIAEMKEGMTLVESEKFEKLAAIVEFSKDKEFGEKLETIKESIKGTPEVVDENLDESDKNKPVWSHLV